MSLVVKVNPFIELAGLNDWLEEEFACSYPYSKDESWQPAVDILENGNEYLIKVELPEVDEKDIDMSIEKNVLTLKGERRIQDNTEDGSFRRTERHYGSFQRSFMLPDSVDTDKVTAHLERGVMKIVLPKKEETKPRSIKIEPR